MLIVSVDLLDRDVPFVFNAEQEKFETLQALWRSYRNKEDGAVDHFETTVEDREIFLPLDKIIGLGAEEEPSRDFNCY